MSCEWHKTLYFVIMGQRLFRYGNFNVASTSCTLRSYWRHWGRQTAYVSTKTKSGSRLVKYDMIVHHQSLCVEPRISIISNRAATSLWYFRKQEIRYQQHLCLLVQVNETCNSWPQWLRSDFTQNRSYDLA